MGPYHPFSIKLLSTLSEITHLIGLNRLDMKVGSLDEYLDGFYDYHKTRACRLWFVVACQCYKDVYDVVGTKPAVFLREMCKAVREIGATEKAYFKFLKTYERETNQQIFDTFKSRTSFNRDVEEWASQAGRELDNLSTVGTESVDR